LQEIQGISQLLPKFFMVTELQVFVLVRVTMNTAHTSFTRMSKPYWSKYQ